MKNKLKTNPLEWFWGNFFTILISWQFFNYYFFFFGMILRKFLHKFDFVKIFNYYFFFIPTDEGPSNPCNEFAFRDSVVLGWGLIMWLSWKKERTWDPSNFFTHTHTQKHTLVSSTPTFGWMYCGCTKKLCLVSWFHHNVYRQVYSINKCR